SARAEPLRDHLEAIEEPIAIIVREPPDGLSIADEEPTFAVEGDVVRSAAKLGARRAIHAKPGRKLHAILDELERELRCASGRAGENDANGGEREASEGEATSGHGDPPGSESPRITHGGCSVEKKSSPRRTAWERTAGDGKGAHRRGQGGRRRRRIHRRGHGGKTGSAPQGTRRKKTKKNSPQRTQGTQGRGRSGESRSGVLSKLPAFPSPSSSPFPSPSSSPFPSPFP